MGIRSIRYALPSVRQTASDIANMTGAHEEFISEKVGVRQRYLLGPGETGIGLAVQACERLFQEKPELPDNVDLLVCVTQNPDQRIPHNAPSIATRLGIRRSLATFDISLGCSGYVYGIDIVEGFLRSTGMRNGLLITCDPYSRIIAAEDRDTNCVFGDAATVTWISADDVGGISLASNFGSDGSGGNAIEITAGGALSPFVSILGGNSVRTLGRDELRLHMRGRSVFNFVLATIPDSIFSCLAKANMHMDDVDFAALHQGSLYMLDALARKAGIPPEKVLKNIQSYGNTVSSTIPMLLADLESDGRLNGSTVLMSGFGVGLSWATKIIRFPVATTNEGAL